MHTTFINLDHRTDRLARMTRELARVGLPATRTRGMRPSDYHGDPERVRAMCERTPGSIGGYLTHLNILERASQEREHTLILEDDAQFCSDFSERLEVIKAFCGEYEWDIIWLGGTFHVGPPFWHRSDRSGMDPDCSAHLGRDAERIGACRLIRTYGCFSAYAYLVNNESAIRIWELLEDRMQGSIGIDWSYIALQPQLKTFAFVPGCVKQVDDRSDVATSDMMKFSVFATLNGTLENSAYWWQDRMDDFDPEAFDWKEAR